MRTPNRPDKTAPVNDIVPIDDKIPAVISVTSSGIGNPILHANKTPKIRE
jgi:hypothetical protein